MPATTITPSRSSQTVLVLGARGRFGRAAVAAFSQAGWQVRAFVSSGRQPERAFRGETINGDAFDPGDVVAAANGANVIVHALNPPYPRWRRDLPRLTKSVLATAHASGATVMIPGNVYNYGAGMPETLLEETPHRPTTRKGALRESMEATFRDAANDGVKTIVLRGGDFIEAKKTGNWFDTYIAGKLDSGIVMYPGPLDKVHAWAYLPDMAQAMVGLAERDRHEAGFECFNFEGHNISGRELIDALERWAGAPLKKRNIPWVAMQAIAPFAPLIREVIEMRYLWTTPHALDGTRLREALPEFRPTALPDALAQILPVLSPQSARHTPIETISAA